MNFGNKFAPRAHTTKKERSTVSKLGAFVKGKAQKSPLFPAIFWGFGFSQDRLFSRNSTKNR